MPQFGALRLAHFHLLETGGHRRHTSPVTCYSRHCGSRVQAQCNEDIAPQEFRICWLSYACDRRQLLVTTVQVWVQVREHIAETPAIQRILYQQHPLSDLCCGAPIRLRADRVVHGVWCTWTSWRLLACANGSRDLRVAYVFAASISANSSCITDAPRAPFLELRPNAAIAQELAEGLRPGRRKY